MGTLLINKTLGENSELKIKDALWVYAQVKIGELLKNKYLDHVCKTDLLFVVNEIGFAFQIKTNGGFKYTEPDVEKILASKEAKKYNIKRVVSVMVDIVGQNVYELYNMVVDSSSLLDMLIKNASKQKIYCRISYDGKAVVTKTV